MYLPGYPAYSFAMPVYKIMMLLIAGSRTNYVLCGPEEIEGNLLRYRKYLNPCPAEPGYILSLQTVQIQISWLLKKPTDLDLHCLPLSM